MFFLRAASSHIIQVGLRVLFLKKFKHHLCHVDFKQGKKISRISSVFREQAVESWTPITKEKTGDTLQIICSPKWIIKEGETFLLRICFYSEKLWGETEVLSVNSGHWGFIMLLLKGADENACNLHFFQQLNKMMEHGPRLILLVDIWVTKAIHQGKLYYHSWAILLIVRALLSWGSHLPSSNQVGSLARATEHL